MGKKLARKLSVNEREIAVCRRLAKMRMNLGLSQAQVASHLGTSRDRIASYENGRAPLKWDYGAMFCLQFGVSAKWLATGHPPAMSADMPPYASIYKISSSMTFGEAYDRFLATYFAARLLSDRGPDVERAQPSLRSSKHTLDLMVKFWKSNVHEADMATFVRGLWLLGEEFRKNKAAAKFKAMSLAKEEDFDPFDLFGVGEYLFDQEKPKAE